MSGRTITRFCSVKSTQEKTEVVAGETQLLVFATRD